MVAQLPNEIWNCEPFSEPILIVKLHAAIIHHKPLFLVQIAISFYKLLAIWANCFDRKVLVACFNFEINRVVYFFVY